MKYQDNQHFSHIHILNPLILVHGDNITCKACQQTILDPDFHGCIKCSYYLHDSCLNTPRSLLHSSHPSHPLTLHPTPLYPTNSFTCDACHSLGNSFSLSCAHCDYDLHIQ
ncbi:hypothetical protein LIER_01523 [Lithospermum erythrorhizon]|uniref:DC1 domain-containing protein n=1 Tax=Lithospermum erythrorhizon TaxID=34254 RepID=A0AAV3NNK6_LITER